MLAIDSPFTDPYLNLAAEEYLLKEMEDEVFFLYSDKPSVIVGKHQVTLAEVNYLFAGENNIRIARRLSGGGAVYHDAGNLNFTFIRNGSEGALVQFEACTAPVLLALNELHIPAERGDKNDLLIYGKKISGNAEHVYHQRTLHHGTLLFDSDLEHLKQVLHPSGKYTHKGVNSRRSEVVNIASFLSNPDRDAFRKFLFSFVVQHFRAVIYSLTDEDKRKIIELSAAKFNTWEWIYAYSPDYQLEREVETPYGTVHIKLSVAKGYINQIRLTGTNVQKELDLISGALQGARLEENYLLKTIADKLPSSLSSEVFNTLLPALF
ncbi:MAG: lipoate--protein ligase [Bacteroidales bacterium]|nr:lipoate--protein ligase [Bacteroidales bacterium]